MLYNIELDITSAQRDHLKIILDSEPNVPGSNGLYRVMFQSLTETQKLTIIRQLTETTEQVPVLVLPDELIVKNKTWNVTEISKLVPNEYCCLDVTNMDNGAEILSLTAKKYKFTLTIIDIEDNIYHIKAEVPPDGLGVQAEFIFLLPSFIEPITTAILSYEV